MNKQVDVLILGAGLAGLSLARQILMRGGKTILHLEKRPEIPSPRQKVGESQVQVAGFYYGKMLDLETYLFHEHFMKYNLRFLWKTPGRSNNDFFDFGQSYIRHFSNIPCYQVDRNKLEGDLMGMNQEDPNYELVTGATAGDIQLGKGGTPHQVICRMPTGDVSVSATWVVDTTGRNRQLARGMGLHKTSEINHNASFFWVDGTIDIEKLSSLSPQQRLRHQARKDLGHLPFWLATNHFMGEGFWFWVIPLQGKTSFGLVYDPEKIDPHRVNREERFRDWLREEFPLFDDAFRDKPFIDFSILRHFSHNCFRTISADKWAMAGEAGRFTDPLYSPGSDMIAIHNTLITDAIFSRDEELSLKTSLYESMFKTVYQSFVPTFNLSYQALGDHQTFYLKYVWELAVYFAFYVFPFISGHFTDRIFLVGYFKRFSALGKVNRTLQQYLGAYFDWKKMHVPESRNGEPRFLDFMALEPLQRTEKTFYMTGLEPKQALAELDRQLENLRGLARFFIAYLDAAVLDEPDLVSHKEYVAAIDLEDRTFDPNRIARDRFEAGEASAPFTWPFDVTSLMRGFACGEAVAETVAP